MPRTRCCRSSNSSAARSPRSHSPGNDYKALVCIFLFGGSDSFNMLIPHEAAEHAAYLTSRGGVFEATTNPFGLGYDRDALVQVTDTGGKTWGLNPGCTAMKPLFDAGELAFLANIGPLAVPSDEGRRHQAPEGVAAVPVLAQRPAEAVDARAHQPQRPHRLGRPAGRSRRGFQPRLQSLPPSISISGSNLFQFGQTTLPFAMSSGGAATINRFRTNSNNADRIRYESLRGIIEASHTPIMQDQYAVIGESAINLNDTLRVRSIRPTAATSPPYSRPAAASPRSCAWSRA